VTETGLLWLAVSLLFGIRREQEERNSGMGLLFSVASIVALIPAFAYLIVKPLL
jgi:hypothetical protein